MKEGKVLITGASSGIGLAVARALKNLGYLVIGTCRDPDALKDREEGIEYVKLDFLDEQTINGMISSVGSVDILINNAGASQIGAIEDTPLEKVREIFQVNLFGHIYITRAFLPQMRKRGKGYIINISSMAAEFPVPFQSGYVSSKSAFNGWSWSLRNEVMKYGIKVAVIEPNDIRTSITPELLCREDSIYKTDVMRMKNVRDKRMKHAVETSIVAQKVVAVLKNNSPGPFHTVGGMGPFLVFLKRFLPHWLVETLVRNEYKV
jgi:short-subunit dehydrogenase